MFDAVAEGSRREILDLLAAGPRAVGQIATETGLSQPSDYLLELTLAASLLAAPRVGRRRSVPARPRRRQPVLPTTLLVESRLPLAERRP